MNIFFIDRDYTTCAKMHNDKHVVKMILEYAQLLSTAHRVLDGTITEGKSPSGRKRTTYVLNDNRESRLYVATHVNHPSAIWVRQSYANYVWLSHLLTQLCAEYTYRYGKKHKVESSGLEEELMYPPMNIPNAPFTEPPPAMPEQYRVTGNSIQSYHNYYLNDKRKMSRWTNREMPSWFAEGINTLYNDAVYMFFNSKLDRIVSMPMSQYK